jgi:hypothetical protein
MREKKMMRRWEFNFDFTKWDVKSPRSENLRKILNPLWD